MGTRLNCQNLVLGIMMFSQTQTPFFFSYFYCLPSLG